MSEAFEEASKKITESKEYQSLGSHERGVVNGVLSLLEMGMVPPVEMAKTVLMTALGMTLRDHEQFMTLVDGGIHHIKGTADLVLIAGGWAWKLSAEALEELDMNDVEPM